MITIQKIVAAVVEIIKSHPDYATSLSAHQTQNVEEKLKKELMVYVARFISLMHYDLTQELNKELTRRCNTILSRGKDPRESEGKFHAELTQDLETFNQTLKYLISEGMLLFTSALANKKITPQDSKLSLAFMMSLLITYKNHHDLPYNNDTFASLFQTTKADNSQLEKVIFKLILEEKYHLNPEQDHSAVLDEFVSKTFPESQDVPQNLKPFNGTAQEIWTTPHERLFPNFVNINASIYYPSADINDLIASVRAAFIFNQEISAEISDVNTLLGLSNLLENSRSIANLFSGNARGNLSKESVDLFFRLFIDKLQDLTKNYYFKNFLLDLPIFLSTIKILYESLANKPFRTTYEQKFCTLCIEIIKLASTSFQQETVNNDIKKYAEFYESCIYYSIDTSIINQFFTQANSAIQEKVGNFAFLKKLSRYITMLNDLDAIKHALTNSHVIHNLFADFPDSIVRPNQILHDFFNKMNQHCASLVKQELKNYTSFDKIISFLIALQHLASQFENNTFSYIFSSYPDKTTIFNKNDSILYVNQLITNCIETIKNYFNEFMTAQKPFLINDLVAQASRSSAMLGDTLRAALPVTSIVANPLLSFGQLRFLVQQANMEPLPSLFPELENQGYTPSPKKMRFTQGEASNTR